jgi:hypothetical protein
MTPLVNRHGYKTVMISHGDFRRRVPIHLLVCPTFHGMKPDWAQCVRHLNGDPMDNRPENLTWGTHAENMQDQIDHGHNAALNKTHCKSGHPFNEQNTMVSIRSANGRPRRECRACKNQHARERHHRRKAAEGKYWTKEFVAA